MLPCHSIYTSFLRAFPYFLSHHGLPLDHAIKGSLQNAKPDGKKALVGQEEPLADVPLLEEQYYPQDWCGWSWEPGSGQSKAVTDHSGGANKRERKQTWTRNHHLPISKEMDSLVSWTVIPATTASTAACSCGGHTQGRTVLSMNSSTAWKGLTGSHHSVGRYMVSYTVEVR